MFAWKNCDEILIGSFNREFKKNKTLQFGTGLEGIIFYTLKIHLAKFIKSSFNLLIHCSCSIFVSGMASEVSDFSESKYYLTTLISEIFNV